LTELLTLSKALSPFFLKKELKYIYRTKTKIKIKRTKNRTLKEQNGPYGHARTRTPKNPYQKLPNGTTMLRNTAAGKAAAGPANTSDGETITVLNP